MNESPDENEQVDGSDEDEQYPGERLLDDVGSLLVELRKATAKSLDQSHTVETWHEAIAKRAARDWMTELCNLLSDIEKVPRGTESAKKINRAGELLLAAVKRMLRFLPRRNADSTWNPDAASWDDPNANMLPTRSSDFGRLEALRAEVRGCFMLLESEIVGLHEAELVGVVEKRSERRLQPVWREILKFLADGQARKPKDIKCAGSYLVVRRECPFMREAGLLKQLKKKGPYRITDVGRAALLESQPSRFKSEL